MIPKISRDLLEHLQSEAGTIAIADPEEAELDVAAALVRYRNEQDESDQPRACEELASSLLAAVRASPNLDTASASDAELHGILTARLRVYFPNAPSPLLPGG